MAQNSEYDFFRCSLLKQCASLEVSFTEGGRGGDGDRKINNKEIKVSLNQGT